MTEPPPQAIAAAIAAARRAACDKSRRGVAVYQVGTNRGNVIATGFNGPPMGACTNSPACREVCAKLCVHAEARALQDAAIALGCALRDPAAVHRAWMGLEAVHVKVDAAGELVAGGGPSCWQCSRLVADVNLGGFWLYESQADSVGYAVAASWRRYSASEFHRESLRAHGMEIVMVGPARGREATGR